ncbi:outer membrane protein assembly factor BamA [Harenicola maris]
MRPFQRLSVMLMLGVALPVTALPNMAVAQSFRFTSVEIEGNQRVDASTILTYAGIARGQTVSAAQVNDATQNILNSGLFESVEIAPRGNTLVIKVIEYPTVNRIDFQGNKRIKDEDLNTLVQSRSRRVFTPSLAESDAALITEAYRQQGRLAATVEPKIIRRSDNRVDLVFEITEGRVVEIERLSFIGNSEFNDRRLRRVLETKQAGIFRQVISNDTLVEDRIEFDKQVLRDFYQSRGYVDFQVQAANSELTRTRDGFLVTFNVQEGQQFRFGEVFVSSDLDEIDTAEYENAISGGLFSRGAEGGRVYSPSVVENAIARLERLAIAQGLNFVRVEPRITRNDRDLTLDLELFVTRGDRIFVERIDIEGNSTTLDRVVRRQFKVVEGDPFNAREIRESAERIRALGFFTNADVQAREGSGPDQVIVDVDVEEAPTGSLGFGASFSVDSGIGFNITFSERNFLGRGQSLAFDVNTTDSAQSLGFSFVEPAFLGRDVAFGINTSFRLTESEFTDYDTKRGNFSPFLEFPVSERGRLQARYTLAYDELLNVDTGDDDDATDTGSSFVLREEEGFNWTSGVGYTYEYDSRDVGLNPNAGVLLRFSQDLMGLGGDRRFVRSTLLMAAEAKVLNDEVTLRAELEAGSLNFITGGSTVIDRFNLNGKIRGFESSGVGPRDLNVTNQDALGGENFAVARFEAEFPLGLPEEYGIRGGVFYDVGSVWGLSNTAGGPAGLDLIDDSMRVRSAIGVSIFWTTAIGPLRFNFSEALQKEEYDNEQSFDLTISTRF